MTEKGRQEQSTVPGEFLEKQLGCNITMSRLLRGRRGYNEITEVSAAAAWRGSRAVVALQPEWNASNHNETAKHLILEQHELSRGQCIAAASCDFGSRFSKFAHTSGRKPSRQQTAHSLPTTHDNIDNCTHFSRAEQQDEESTRWLSAERREAYGNPAVSRRRTTTPL